MSELTQGAGLPGIDLQVGGEGCDGREREVGEGVVAVGAVAEFEEEGAGCLAVDGFFGGHGDGGEEVVKRGLVVVHFCDAGMQ